MYKTLLNDYDSRHKDLLMENAELKKVLQQMKRDMVTILSPRKHSQSGEKHDDSLEQVCLVVLSLSWVPNMLYRMVYLVFTVPSICVWTVRLTFLNGL